MMREIDLQELLALHFDPVWGAPYWIEKRGALDFDPMRDIKRIEDLRRFPPMPREDLATRPAEDLLPRRFHSERSRLIIAETGGTSGPPARTLFLPDDFEAAFVAPFVAAAELLAFPREAPWLYVGPSGPHPIGQGARQCARAMGAMEPYSVDFDPRWARRLAGIGLQRYREHILEQALHVLHTQEAAVLFATPPVLAALGEKLPEARRARVQAVHTGGMAPAQEFWRQVKHVWFPNAVIMSGYGNSLGGMCPQISFDPEQPPEYFPHGRRLVYEVLDADGTGRGRLCMHRLDRSCFLPHVLERDEATATHAPKHAAAKGFLQMGLRDPRPPATESAPQVGLY